MRGRRSHDPQVRTLPASEENPYAQIRAVREIGLGSVRRWRLWGTTDPRRWFNLDIGRRHKRAAFIVDIGKRVTPVVTPDDPQRFVAVLRSHGIQVEER